MIVFSGAQNIKRYIDICCSNNGSGQDEDIVEDDFKKMTFRMFECMLESIPQLYLQTYIVANMKLDGGTGTGKKQKMFQMLHCHIRS